VTCSDTVAPHWRERLAACGLKQLALLLDDAADFSRFAGRWETLSKPGLGGRRRWRWELRNGAGEAVIYVKRYAATPLGQQWDRLRRQSLRHSRAYWEFVQSRRLAEAHINVPPAVGFVEEMHGVLERRSAVLLESVPGDGFDRSLGDNPTSSVVQCCALPHRAQDEDAVNTAAKHVLCQGADGIGIDVAVLGQRRNERGNDTRQFEHTSPSLLSS